LEFLKLAVVAYLVGDPENVKRYGAAETREQAAGLFEHENLRTAFDDRATSKLH